MPNQPTLSEPLARHAHARVGTAMDDTRIVALVGPRQSGKTTLARKIAVDRNMKFTTLDDGQSRSFAIDDPDGFVRQLDCAVIDEIQRAPELILALKKTVDENQRPGQFLITGSVDLFKGRISPDSLAGRVETIKLLPFSQAEIERREPSSFLEKAFNSDFPGLEHIGATTDLIPRVLAGGYPEALARHVASRRQAWLTAYAEALASKDVSDIANVEKKGDFSKLIVHAAVAAGQTLNLSNLAAALRIDGKTVDHWLMLLEHMFVVKRVPAHHGNNLKRLVKAPKLHFLDSGLLAGLCRISESGIAADRTKLGPVLEGFVFSELAKLAAQGNDDVSIGHYRDRDMKEVDFVLERGQRIVGIEVKAAASVRPDDFRGLRHLQAADPGNFACGIILHDGERIQEVGDRLFAMPIHALWTGAAQQSG